MFIESLINKNIKSSDNVTLGEQWFNNRSELGIVEGFELNRNEVINPQINDQIPITKMNVQIPDNSIDITKLNTSLDNWFYVSKVVWDNSAAVMAFSGLTVHDRWLIVINAHSNASNIFRINLRMNGISAANYSYSEFGNPGAIIVGQSSLPIVLSGSDFNNVFARILLTGKHFNGVKTVGPAGIAVSFNADGLIYGKLGSDSFDLNTISLDPQNAITGQAELYYQDNK